MLFNPPPCSSVPLISLSLFCIWGYRPLLCSYNTESVACLRLVPSLGTILSLSLFDHYMSLGNSFHPVSLLLVSLSSQPCSLGLSSVPLSPGASLATVVHVVRTRQPPISNPHLFLFSVSTVHLAFSSQWFLGHLSSFFSNPSNSWRFMSFGSPLCMRGNVYTFFFFFFFEAEEE